jgi:transcriptional regulator GlxA family with amidase domain
VGAAPVALEHLAELITMALSRLTIVPPRLDGLWAAVEERLNAPWDLAELARTVGLSAEQLRAICVREHGEPPMRHVVRLRMRRAASLLTGTSDTVDRIAATVGYANAFAFSTAFRRWAGETPTGYRARSRSQIVVD